MKLPTSVAISKKDPAAILHTVFERMDWSVLQGCYSPLGRIEFPPMVLTRLLVCGYMNRNSSSRGIERNSLLQVAFAQVLSSLDHNIDQN